MTPVTQTQIRDSVLQFLQSNFMFDQKKQVPDNQSLLESGIVDSTGILELIGFLEDTYQVKFHDEELIAENFDTLAKLTSFLLAKLMSPGASLHASA
jgi:acyl carrier protein